MEVADLAKCALRHVLTLIDRQHSPQAVKDIDGLLGERELSHSRRRSTPGHCREDPGVGLLATGSVGHVNPVHGDAEPREHELGTKGLAHARLAIDEDDPAVIEEVGDTDTDLS